MKVSIIIPVYNEEKTVADVIAVVKSSVKKQNLNAEIVVVNDGSQDASAEILRSVEGIVFIDQKVNQGKGAAVKAGFKAATGDILLIQDADLEYDPQDYSAVIAPIVQGQSPVVMGSRFIHEKLIFWGTNKSPYFTHYIGNKAIVWLTNFLYRFNATDYEGCYKAFSKPVIDSIPIRSNGFEFDNELICKILKRKIKIVEVPIHYLPRSYENGKKITWKHGLKMLWTILKFRLVD